MGKQYGAKIISKVLELQTAGYTQREIAKELGFETTQIKIWSSGTAESNGREKPSGHLQDSHRNVHLHQCKKKTCGSRS